MSTISKALDLLNLFSPDRPEMGLAEITRVSGRDKATVHRHLKALTENGFLEQNLQTRAYRLGPALLRLSAVREACFPVRKLLRPIVTALSEAVGELAHASLLQGDVLSPVFHADPHLHGIQVHFDESELLPLHATSSGLAALAFSSPEAQARALARPLAVYTDETITDRDHLRAMINETRRAGFSQMGGAFDAEVASVGTPLIGQDNDVIGALSVAVPKARATPQRMSEIAETLMHAAAGASHSLGGTAPSAPVPVHATRRRPV